MATAPAFSATPNRSSALLGSAETDTQAPAQTSTVFTAGANGSKVYEITVEASKSASLAPVTVAGLVYVFIHNGSSYFLLDVLTVVAVTGSATVAPFRISKLYPNLLLVNGDTIKCSQSEASNASLLVVTAIGGDF